MFDTEGGCFFEETTVYPGNKYSFVHVPDGIVVHWSVDYSNMIKYIDFYGKPWFSAL